VAALVDIDTEIVGRWAEQRLISFTSQVDLSQHPDVYALIEAELAAVNATLPEASRIARFINLFKPFDADEGELTRSRKLRRSVIEQKYADLVEGLYGEDDSIAASIAVNYQDGRSRVVAGQVQVRTVAGTGQRPGRQARAPQPAQKRERDAARAAIP
jgi:long-chain acyl-CoA synthetase